MWDVYCWAENEADANEAALANIASGELPPSEYTSYDVGKQPVRAAWLNEKPLVGNAVSDDDFETVKGKTCKDVWELLNKKGEVIASSEAKKAAAK